LAWEHAHAQVEVPSHLPGPRTYPEHPPLIKPCTAHQRTNRPRTPTHNHTPSCHPGQPHTMGNHSFGSTAHGRTSPWIVLPWQCMHCGQCMRCAWWLLRSPWPAWHVLPGSTRGAQCSAVHVLPTMACPQTISFHMDCAALQVQRTHCATRGALSPWCAAHGHHVMHVCWGQGMSGWPGVAGSTCAHRSMAWVHRPGQHMPCACAPRPAQHKPAQNKTVSSFKTRSG
jgi:hypothetical protein